MLILLLSTKVILLRTTEKIKEIMRVQVVRAKRKLDQYLNTLFLLVGLDARMAFMILILCIKACQIQIMTHNNM